MKITATTLMNLYAKNNSQNGNQTRAKRHIFISKKFKIGEFVEGRRLPVIHKGILLGCYYTECNYIRKYCYVLACEDGKERSFQHIRRI